MVDPHLTKSILEKVVLTLGQRRRLLVSLLNNKNKFAIDPIGPLTSHRRVAPTDPQQHPRGLREGQLLGSQLHVLELDGDRAGLWLLLLHLIGLLLSIQYN